MGSESESSALYWRNAYEELVRQTGRDLNDGYGIDPRKARPSPLSATPPEEQGGLAWLASHVNLELSWGELDSDPSECGWVVHRISGHYNDREWELIATGETPAEALDSARAALTPPLILDGGGDQGDMASVASRSLPTASPSVAGQDREGH